MLKRITMTGCALGAALAVAAPAFAQTHAQSTAVAPSGPSLYVNGATGSDTSTAGSDNTCRLQAHPCATIQHAITEAPSPSIVKVAPGNYQEQLTISGKNVVIQGTGKATNPTVIDPDPSTLAPTTNDPNHAGTPQFDMITFDGTSAAGLTNVVVDGRGGSATEGCGDNFVGVYFHNAGGAVKTSTVQNVTHLTNSAGCQSGANGGIYVASDDGVSHAVTMATDKVTNYNKDGITCRDATVSCTITGSTVTGIGATDLTAQNGIEVFGIDTASISGTKVTANTYRNPQFTSLSDAPASASGILAINDNSVTINKDTVTGNDDNIVGEQDGNPGSYTITGNTANGATNVASGQPGAIQVPIGDGVGDGIDLYGINGLILTGNTVSNNADWGIGVFGVTNSNIGGTTKGLPNTASKNGDDGIIVGEDTTASTGNVFAKNTAASNKRDGIEVLGADSGGNQQAGSNAFTANTLTGNTRFDAEDLSTGSGTGTGATNNDQWSANVCKPKNDSNPVALCTAP